MMFFSLDGLILSLEFRPDRMHLKIWNLFRLLDTCTYVQEIHYAEIVEH